MVKRLIKQWQTEKLYNLIDDTTNLISILFYYCEEHNDGMETIKVYSMLKCINRLSNDLYCYFADLIRETDELEVEC